MKNTDRVLVTGGNGFIGTHVVDLLRERGLDVTILDCFGVPHRKDVRFVLGDVRNEDTLFELAEDHGAIVNLAGLLGTSETIDRAKVTVDFNIFGAFPVFETARLFGTRVVHVTVGNYWMNNPYAITKNVAEKVALHYNAHYKTKIAVVRGLNCYGERQKPEPIRKLIPNLIVPALSSGIINVFGDGKQEMDMIYVRDCAEVLVRAALEEHSGWDKVFEAGSGIGFTINELVEMVFEAAGRRCHVRHVPMRAGETERSRVVGDPATLKPLGLSEDDFLPLREGLARTVAHYRSELARA